jgi:hypothetical protein
VIISSARISFSEEISRMQAGRAILQPALFTPPSPAPILPPTNNSLNIEYSTPLILFRSTLYSPFD